MYTDFWSILDVLFDSINHRYRISIYKWYISRNIAWEWNKILSCYIYIPPVEYISRHGLLNNTDWFVAEKIRQIIFYDTCNYFLCEIPSGERKKKNVKKCLFKLLIQSKRFDLPRSCYIVIDVSWIHTIVANTYRIRKLAKQESSYSMC